MPTYEYKCPQGHHFDLFQKMSDEPRATCPECGAESERQISAGAGFLFKGDGFYITDYRSDSYKKEASKEGTAGVSGKAKDKKPEKKGASPSTSGTSSTPGTGSSSGGSSSKGDSSSKESRNSFRSPPSSGGSSSGGPKSEGS